MLVSKKDIEYNKKSRIPRGFFFNSKKIYCHLFYASDIFNKKTDK